MLKGEYPATFTEVAIKQGVLNVGRASKALIETLGKKHWLYNIGCGNVRLHSTEGRVSDLMAFKQTLARRLRLSELSPEDDRCVVQDDEYAFKDGEDKEGLDQKAEQQKKKKQKKDGDKDEPEKEGRRKKEDNRGLVRNSLGKLPKPVKHKGDRSEDDDLETIESFDLSARPSKQSRRSRHRHYRRRDDYYDPSRNQRYPDQYAQAPSQYPPTYYPPMSLYGQLGPGYQQPGVAPMMGYPSTTPAYGHQPFAPPVLSSAPRPPPSQKSPNPLDAQLLAANTKIHALEARSETLRGFYNIAGAATKALDDLVESIRRGDRISNDEFKTMADFNARVYEDF